MQSARRAAADARVRAPDPRHGPSPLPIDAIEGYELLRELHRGGQGIVYEGVRKSTNRTVAIKVLREGPFAGPSERARFEREIRILGALHDSRIVAIHDSGTTRGIHYLVMDYIAGRPIDAFLEARTPESSEILSLFAQISDAVSTAHLLGIVHRDLKPGNILIDDAGTPHVLDFGLARKSADSTDQSSIRPDTLTGQFIGSLPWASPEQASGAADEITPRTDVYALGVLLYHALTRRFPYPVAGPIDEVLRHIQHAVPVSPRSLRRGIDDEIQTIVLKCLAKEPARRYESAGDLARDLRRYLADEPIEAKRESAWYLLRKSLRRHRTAFGIAAAFAAVLTASSIMSWSLFVDARDQAALARVAESEAKSQERIADAQARRAERINEFVVAALQSADPYKGGKPEILVGDAMMQSLEKINAGAFDDDPQTKAGLLGAISAILNGNGRSRDALPVAEQSLALFRDIHHGDHSELARALTRVGLILQDLGRHDEALELHDQALEMHRRLHHGDHPDIASSMNNLATAEEALGRYSDARPLLEESLAMCRRLFPGDHDQTPFALNNLGYLLQRTGRPQEARPLFQEALDMRQRLLKGDHPEIATSLGNLAFVTGALDGPAAAEPLHEQALEMQKRLFKGDHGMIASTLNNLASVRKALGRLPEAEALYQQSLDMRRRLFGTDHPDIARGLQNLAATKLSLHRPAEAEPLYQEALEIRRRIYIGDHLETARSLNELALVRQRLDRPAEAEPLRREALEMLRRIHGPDDPAVVVALAKLSGCLAEARRLQEAQTIAQEAVELANRILPERHPSREMCDDLIIKLRQMAADAAEESVERR